MFKFVAFEDDNTLHFFDINSSTRFAVTKEDSGFECILSSYQPSMEIDGNIELEFEQKYFDYGADIEEIMNAFYFYEYNWDTDIERFKVAIVKFVSRIEI